MGKYPYYNRETLGVDFDDMIAHLEAKTKAGDIVLLHGCCHNPTGADLSPAQWDKLVDFMVAKQLTPYIDLAYFGLGRGMSEDTYGLRRAVDKCPEVIIAASCSKNFALYKERVGLIAIVCKDAETAEITRTKLRADYSIYMTDSGRINIAGANSENIPRLAAAILAVL